MPSRSTRPCLVLRDLLGNGSMVALPGRSERVQARSRPGRRARGRQPSPIARAATWASDAPIGSTLANQGWFRGLRIFTPSRRADREGGKFSPLLDPLEASRALRRWSGTPRAHFRAVLPLLLEPGLDQQALLAVLVDVEPQRAVAMSRVNVLLPEVEGVEHVSVGVDDVVRGTHDWPLAGLAIGAGRRGGMKRLRPRPVLGCATDRTASARGES